MSKLFFISGPEDSLDSEDEDATPTITKTSKPLPLQTKKMGRHSVCPYKLNNLRHLGLCHAHQVGRGNLEL